MDIHDLLPEADRNNPQLERRFQSAVDARLHDLCEVYGDGASGVVQELLERAIFWNNSGKKTDDQCIFSWFEYRHMQIADLEEKDLSKEDVDLHNVWQSIRVLYKNHEGDIGVPMRMANQLLLDYFHTLPADRQQEILQKATNKYRGMWTETTAEDFRTRLHIAIGGARENSVPAESGDASKGGKPSRSRLRKEADRGQILFSVNDDAVGITGVPKAD